MVATKAARCIQAAHGRSLVDFSLRRTQGMDAGMKVARASYIAGFDATSNVLAGVTYGIPISGTIAHSYISSYEHEIEAFRAFARSFPEHCILLIETYNTIAGARNAVTVAREMANCGQQLWGIRIDSGDLPKLGRQVRHLLDNASLREVKIIGSGGLDEFELEQLWQDDAPYDAYGIGTKMGVSGDAPWTDMAYKLVHYNSQPVLKLSAGKATLPDTKQVFRFTEAGKMHHDVIALHEELITDAEPLLQQVMFNGDVLIPLPTIAEIRDSFSEEFHRLGDSHKALSDPAIYPVKVSAKLKTLKNKIKVETIANEMYTALYASELGES
jgi:nicotinate phosphoribosyltransferase